ncbi:MAG: hypothetical protein CVT70_10445 [Alphaproteobacteria bacterium HGW-Alphaproteobacteria-1]|jgi:glycosyltransferase involved in cell wall biosynthesis|nr:MAG: hypothetical protein CVT70_10445 [Alphaproteobacteria bacterium HGW-Alphaproteobacteria-1]
MKICFLSSMHPANDKRVHDKEARSLVEGGFDVRHICPGPDNTRQTVDGVQIQYYVSGNGLRGRIFQLHRLYRLAVAENADAYHCNEVDSWGVGVALKILNKKICVFDVHEHYPSTFAESRFPKWAQPAVAGLVRLVFRLFLPFTDRIVLAKRTVSDDFKCSDSKKVLVQNFTPMDGLSVAPDKSVRIATQRLTIVHLGLFSKVRGWPQVLEAMAKTDDRVHLKVIGAFNDGTLDEFQSTVSRLNLVNRIEVFEWMPFNEAFHHLTDADVGLIAFQPSIQNHVFAMPHKLFDYMAAGLSVLMPKQAIEVAPIVEETRCGLLIDPADPEDIARGIEVLLKDPVESNLMGRRGRTAVIDTYNWESEAMKLLRMYEELNLS